MTVPNLYATDGLCHNAELAWYGQECGRPATWIGFTAAGWGAGFCDRCKDGGRDTRNKVRWERIEG